MKKLFSLLLCVVMVLSLVACGSKTDDAQTPDEPQDTAPELSGTMKVVATGDVYGPLFDAFTADTGVEVECLSMSSGEVLSKLRAEGGTPSADLWFGGGIDAFMSAKDDGLLEPVTFDAAAELGDEYKDTEGYWYSKGITIVGFLLNNSLMEELGLTAPESWDDLTDSQYAGEIVMSNPAVSGTNYAVVNALLQAKGDEGWNYFEALNNNIAYYGKRGSDPKNKVSAGEFAVGITYIGASIEQAAEENDLTIAIEPLRAGECNIMNFVSEATLMASLIQMPHIAVLGDTYHMEMGSEPFSALTMAGSLLKHVHVANVMGRKYPKEGDGEKYDELFETLRGIGYNGRVSVEGGCDDFSRDARDAFKVLNKARG